jgi:hypothetical protein
LDNRAEERPATWSFYWWLTQVLACTAAEPLIKRQTEHGAVEDLVPDQLLEAAIDHVIDACERAAFELVHESGWEGGLDGVAKQRALRAKLSAERAHARLLRRTRRLRSGFAYLDDSGPPPLERAIAAAKRWGIGFAGPPPGQ